MPAEYFLLYEDHEDVPVEYVVNKHKSPVTVIYACYKITQEDKEDTSLIKYKNDDTGEVMWLQEMDFTGITISEMPQA